MLVWPKVAPRKPSTLRPRPSCHAVRSPPSPTKLSRRRSTPLPIAFPTGQPDRAAFPFALWAKLLEREWRKPSWAIAGALHPFGHPGLREAIATYLGMARGFGCEAAPSS